MRRSSGRLDRPTTTTSNKEMEVKQATKIAELIILIIALALSALADILPVIGRIAGRCAGRVYRNRHKPVAWLKIAYATIRYGNHGRVYTANYLTDADPDFIRDFSVDNHCRMMARHFRSDRERALKLYAIRAYRRLTALYRASYGMITQWLIAQNGIPATVPDPRIVKIQRQQWIRSLMANY